MNELQGFVENKLAKGTNTETVMSHNKLSRSMYSMGSEKQVVTKCRPKSSASCVPSQLICLKIVQRSQRCEGEGDVQDHAIAQKAVAT